MASPDHVSHFYRYRGSQSRTAPWKLLTGSHPLLCFYSRYTLVSLKWKHHFLCLLPPDLLHYETKRNTVLVVAFYKFPISHIILSLASTKRWWMINMCRCTNHSGLLMLYLGIIIYDGDLQHIQIDRIYLIKCLG